MFQQGLRRLVSAGSRPRVQVSGQGSQGAADPWTEEWTGDAGLWYRVSRETNDGREWFVEWWLTRGAFASVRCSDLIFDVPRLVSFCSQGTTLPAGTVILTGTPAGVGVGKKPQEFLRDGDEFAVEILPHVGTLYTVFEAEK